MGDYPAGNRETLWRARTRIELRHDPRCFAKLLNDGVVLVLLDGSLELREVVARLDRKLDGRASDRLVLSNRELDHLDTVGVGAFTQELGMRRVVGRYSPDYRTCAVRLLQAWALPHSTRTRKGSDERSHLFTG